MSRKYTDEDYDDDNDSPVSADRPSGKDGARGGEDVSDKTQSACAAEIAAAEKNFFANLTYAKLYYTPVKTGPRNWLFFSVFALTWLLCAVAFTYTAIRSGKALFIVLCLFVLLCMLAGGLSIIRGRLFYYYDLFVFRTGNRIVTFYRPFWNKKSITVYFSHDKIYRYRRGRTEDVSDYAYRYVGSHLLFNKFRNNLRYGQSRPGETVITGSGKGGGAARIRLADGKPQSITFCPSAGRRTEFGEIKYLRFDETGDGAGRIEVPLSLKRVCEKNGLAMPEEGAYLVYYDDKIKSKKK